MPGCKFCVECSRKHAESVVEKKNITVEGVAFKKSSFRKNCKGTE